MGGKSVSRGRAFRQHIHVLAKRHRHPADSRGAACRPRLTAAQGPRVEQRAIVARTFQKGQSRAGAARRSPTFLFNFLRRLRPGFPVFPRPGFPAKSTCVSS